MAWKLGIGTLLLSIIGCHSPEPSNEFVARVGDSYLLQSDLDSNLEIVPNHVDSIQARDDVIDQWISRELLYQEALRQDLGDQQDIQRRLLENSRTILIDAMISEYNRHAENELTQDAIAQYYESYKVHFRFLGPFVRIRYLHHSIQDTLLTALEMLRQSSVNDSTFMVMLERFSSSPADDLQMNQNYLLENNLFLHLPELSSTLRSTAPGSLPQILLADSVYHLLHVIDRSPPDSIPELSWIEGFIREQLEIRLRTQHYNRNIQRLRVEAEFRDEIEIR